MKSLWIQFAILSLASLVVGIGNNFRASAKMEWVRDWPPYSSVAKKKVAESQTPQLEVAGIATDVSSSEPSMPAEDPQQASAEVSDFVAANQGITEIGLEQAKKIHKYASDFTLWIDARSPELYEEGHIQNAFLCYLYDKNHYLPLLEQKIAEFQPVSLVVYCKGEECTDSHTLSQDLQGLGFDNIFVYTGGFEHWYKANLPIEGKLASAPVTTGSGEQAAPRRELAEKPPGMYLEHVVRDLAPFVLGLFIAIFWRKSQDSKPVLWASAAMVGLFFVWAAIPKLHSPFLFAKDIWNYDLAPAWSINLSAMIMPGVELIAGLSLLTGFMRRAGSLMIGILLVIFILAVGFNMGRGHEFNCGCMATTPLILDTYLTGWNDKLLLLLRDFGLLASTALLFLKSGPTRA